MFLKQIPEEYLFEVYIYEMSDYGMIRSVPVREDKTETIVCLPIEIHRIAFFLVV